MQAIRIQVLLFFAVAMFAAKPFIGFSTSYWAANDTQATILAKAFTKRKQEFVEDSDFDVIAVQKRIAEPLFAAFLALSFFLSGFFARVFAPVKAITGRVLSDIRYGLVPPEQLYLLGGKLSI
ncbi:hypothetical protein [Mucilaginibacter pedocola]|uniref:Uncharacterized protein n=1 Tax=Mucilaginibacter pedocola TaxID=1792845 RepID=A0A1S9PCP8_9SPHI|nr:hypothetical protein [Mucilaginibacter pedocola]OOQ58730.1 hypothetical protein BC343_08710 [Mucilaginibacter pedocola]